MKGEPDEIRIAGLGEGVEHSKCAVSQTVVAVEFDVADTVTAGAFKSCGYRYPLFKGGRSSDNLEDRPAVVVAQGTVNQGNPCFPKLGEGWRAGNPAD